MIYIIIAALIILGFVANKEGKLTEYLSTVVVGILGYLTWKKNPAADTLKDNTDALNVVANLDKSIVTNNTTIAVEEQKQTDLKKDIENAKTVDNSLNVITDFLNKR